MTRIAIVHERWTELGGSETVVRELAAEWPGAPVHVAFADPRSVPGDLRDRLRVTPLDALHRATGRRTHAPLIPLAPVAFRGLRPDPVEVAVISHHAVAVSAARAFARAGVPTVAYVHSPARWAWLPESRAGEPGGAAGRAALALLAAQARAVETAAVPDLTAIVTNSSAVADRIRRWWGVPATVVPPPVDVRRFTPPAPSERTSRPVPGGERYFLIAGRLVPYRRVDLAIRAAQRAGVRLIVAGSGRHEPALRALARDETRFLGRVSDQEMVDLQRGALATLVPGEEDFGIVAVEAMATGTPVIARAAGGALDTVLPGLSGILLEDTSDGPFVEALAAAMGDFRAAAFDPAELRAHAERFSAENFRARMRAVVDGVASS